jgi:hypothetical protein
LKLRLGVEKDEEVKRILRRLYNLRYHKEKYKQNKEDEINNNIVVTVFRNEPIAWEPFTQHNLDYLDFPLWLAEMVDRGELSAAQASILNKKEVVEKPRASNNFSVSFGSAYFILTGLTTLRINRIVSSTSVRWEDLSVAL